MKYLIALVILALPAYLVRFTIGGIPTTLLEIIIYVVFIIGLSQMGYCQWGKIKNPILRPIGLLLAAAVISVYISPEKTAALGQIKAFFIDPLLVFYLMLCYLKKEDFPLIFGALAASSLAVAGHTIIQKFSGQVTPDGRVIGLFGYTPNYTAFFLAPITVLLTAYGLHLTASKIKINKIWLLAVSCLLLANLLAVYLSGSRAGLLAMASGMVCYFMIYFRDFIKARPKLKIALVILTILAAVGAGYAFRPNFALSPEQGKRITSSNNIRWQIWQTSWELGQKSPIFGVGLSNFQEAFAQLTQNRVNFPEYITPMALTPHNLFLMFWLSTGLLGLLAFIWLLVWFYRTGLKLLSEPLAPILLATMTVIVIQGIVDTPYFKNDLTVFFWLILGLMILLNRKDKNIESF